MSYETVRAFYGEDAIIEAVDSPYVSVEILSVLRPSQLAKDPCIPDLWYSFNDGPYEMGFDVAKLAEQPGDEKAFTALAAWVVVQHTRHFHVDEAQQPKCELPARAEQTFKGFVKPPLLPVSDPDVTFTVVYENGVWSCTLTGGQLGLRRA